MKFAIGRMNFIKTKFDGLDGKTHVSFKEEAGEFSVRASQSGIKFEGRMSEEISSRKELEQLAFLIAEIWKEHMRLAPKITKTVAGHM